jgi:hypothetical protein
MKARTVGGIVGEVAPKPRNDWRELGLRSRGSVVRIHSSAPTYLIEITTESPNSATYSQASKAAAKHGKSRLNAVVDGVKMGETHFTQLRRSPPE